MSARLRDEGAEVDHHVFAHKVGRVARIRGTAGEVGLGLAFEQRVEVGTAMPEAGEPREVVDAGALPFHFVVGHAGPLGREMAGALD